MNSHVRIPGAFRARTAEPRPAPQAGSARTLSSESLFQGAREIAITHGEAVYRLKITRQGKLILNK